MTQHLYPIFDHMEGSSEKEQLLGQRGMTLWFTGLSGSGKSTLAIALERRLSAAGYLCRILDGDNIRTGINADLGFSESDRRENIRRIAEVAKLFTQTGIITLCTFITPTEELRQMARRIIGEERFFQIWLSTPLEECERRDVKGLYAKARRGDITQMTGISAPFEEPADAALTIDTSCCELEAGVEAIWKMIYPLINR